VAGSADGIHWKLINAFATEAICDGATHWLFDTSAQKYILYGRTKKTLAEVEAAWSKYDWYKQYHSGRAVARVESADFLNWDFTDPASAPVVLTADIDDKPGTEIYSMMVFHYESLYIGLVQIFHARPETCYLDVQLAVSHDSLNFTRVGDRAPFIPAGEIGSWDRFVSLQASYDGGEIFTKPLRLAGSNLHLNAKSNFGEIVVEVLDLAGNSIAKSKTIKSNSLDIAVDWKRGSLKGVEGSVVLHFTLKNACLFAMWCT